MFRILWRFSVFPSQAQNTNSPNPKKIRKCMSGKMIIDISISFYLSKAIKFQVLHEPCISSRLWGEFVYQLRIVLPTRSRNILLLVSQHRKRKYKHGCGPRNLGTIPCYLNFEDMLGRLVDLIICNLYINSVAFVNTSDVSSPFVR